MKSFLSGVGLGLLWVTLIVAATFAAGCVHTEVELPNNGGRYSSTSFLATRQARAVNVKLGPDKSVTISGYGQDGTETAKEALNRIP